MERPRSWQANFRPSIQYLRADQSGVGTGSQSLDVVDAPTVRGDSVCAHDPRMRISAPDKESGGNDLAAFKYRGGGRRNPGGLCLLERVGRLYRNRDALRLLKQTGDPDQNHRADEGDNDGTDQTPSCPNTEQPE